MRVRILKQSTGILHGVSMSTLVPGLVYEVPAMIGTFLLDQNAAEEDVTDALAVVLRIDETPVLLDGASVTPIDRAEDRQTRRKRDTQRKR